MKGFKPFGIPMCKLESVALTYEGYESIKLVDYENLSQEEAALRMNISRPTLTRIYNKALKVIAKAFVEGKVIEIEGGSFHLDTDWYRCRKCSKLINGMENHVKCRNCESFGLDELILLNPVIHNSLEK